MSTCRLCEEEVAIEDQRVEDLSSDGESEVIVLCEECECEYKWWLKSKNQPEQEMERSA